MTRLWPEGIPIAVSLDSAEMPNRFSWQGQIHPIAEVCKHWRVKVDWWRDPAWRDYFKVTTKTGLLVVIYHDLQTKMWYLQRLYD